MEIYEEMQLFISSYSLLSFGIKQENTIVLSFGGDFEGFCAIITPNPLLPSDSILNVSQ
jgi:hypothetical protein